MKRVTLILAVLFLVIFSQKTNAQANSNEVQNQKSVQNDTLLDNIQQKVKKAMYSSFATKNAEPLNNLEKSLENDKTANANLKKYWISYINYYKTIVYMQLKNDDLAEKSDTKGIDVLESIKDKNADDYALLVLLKNLSYKFVAPMEMQKISVEIESLLRKGLKVDNENIRLYYAQAETDFYKPKQYGGGKVVEKALKKAIELPEKNTENSQLPTWGKEESYTMIIAYYLRENQKEKAKTYYDKAIKIFPNNYRIKGYQSKF